MLLRGSTFLPTWQLLSDQVHVHPRGSHGTDMI